MLALKRSIKLIACSLALVQLFIVICQAAPGGQGEEKGKEEEGLAKPRLCHGDNLKLTRFEDLKQISTDECPPGVKKKFDELLELIKVENVCTMDLVTRLTKFCDVPKEDRNEEIQRVIDIAFIFGAQISNDCKLQLKKFYYDVAKTLNQNDFDTLEPWTRNDGLMGRLLNQNNNDNKNGFMDLLSHSVDPTFRFLSYADLSYRSPGREDKYKLVVRVNVGEYKELINVQYVCDNRFRPMYEKSILPIIHLTRYGFKYEHSATASSLDGKETREKTMLWSRIVLLCDTLRQIKFVEVVPSGDNIQARFFKEVVEYRIEEDIALDRDIYVNYEYKVNLDESKVEGYLKTISSPKKYQNIQAIYPRTDKVPYKNYLIDIEDKRFEQMIVNMIRVLKRRMLEPTHAMTILIERAIQIAWDSTNAEEDCNSDRGKFLLQTIWHDPRQTRLTPVVWKRSNTSIRFGRGLQFMLDILVAFHKKLLLQD